MTDAQQNLFGREPSDFRERIHAQATQANGGQDCNAAPAVPEPTATPRKLRPIEAVTHCDGCGAEGEHFAAARNEFTGAWELYDRPCAEARGVPWGAVPCRSCKRKTSVVVGLIVDGKATPVCRNCAGAVP